jgi:hypothetical protein
MPYELYFLFWNFTFTSFLLWEQLTWIVCLTTLLIIWVSTWFGILLWKKWVNKQLLPPYISEWILFLNIPILSVFFYWFFKKSYTLKDFWLILFTTCFWFILFLAEYFINFYNNFQLWWNFISTHLDDISLLPTISLYLLCVLWYFIINYFLKNKKLFFTFIYFPIIFIVTFYFQYFL